MDKLLFRLNTSYIYPLCVPITDTSSPTSATSTFSLNLIASSLVPGNTSSPTAATSVGVGIHLYVNVYVNVYMYMHMYVNVNVNANVDMDADMDVHAGIYQILRWTMMETIDT